MDSQRFDNLCNNQIDHCFDVLCSKSKEYAVNNDRLHNFRVASALQHVPMKTVLAGMMAKHTISIYDMCGTSEDVEYPKELWKEKITDSINYLLLLNAVIQEDMDSKTCEDTSDNILYDIASARVFVEDNPLYNRMVEGNLFLSDKLLYEIDGRRLIGLATDAEIATNYSLHPDQIEYYNVNNPVNWYETLKQLDPFLGWKSVVSTKQIILLTSKPDIIDMLVNTWIKDRRILCRNISVVYRPAPERSA